MIQVLLISAIAAGLVWLAGRGDAARDPRLTTLCLAVLAAFPMVDACLPKLPVLPPAMATRGVGTGGLPWVQLLWWLWALGFMVAMLRLASTLRGIGKWRSHSQHLAWVDLCGSDGNNVACPPRSNEFVDTGICGRRGVEIRSLPGLCGPVASGVWRKVVWVPETWHAWPEATRRIVLEHEIMHHRRRDPLWRWVAEVACAVHWFNPVVGWIARRLAMQCEFACDAAVLRRGVPATDYARLLCDFAEARVPRGPVLAMAGRSSLELRVRRLVRPVRSMSGGLVMCCIAVTLTAAAALAWLGPQPAMVPQAEEFSPQEVELRWSANPFPGQP
jgi:beta-lactamase regulating signal transducer with metallopeptidase domain